MKKYLLLFGSFFLGTVCHAATANDLTVMGKVVTNRMDVSTIGKVTAIGFVDGSTQTTAGYVRFNDEGTYFMNGSSINCVGAAITCTDAGNGVTQIQVTASGSGGGGGGGGFVYTGSANVAFSTISFPLATIVSDGQGGSTVSYSTIFSTIATKDNNLSVATNTILNMVSSNAVVLAGVQLSTNSYANFDGGRASTSDARIGTIGSYGFWVSSGNNQFPVFVSTIIFNGTALSTSAFDALARIATFTFTAGAGSSGQVFGYISTRNIDMSGYALVRSSGIYIGTDTSGLLSLSTTSDVGRPLVSISTGPTIIYEFNKSSATLNIDTFTVQGGIISNSTGISTFNQGVIFNNNNDIFVNSQLLVLGGRATGAQEAVLFVDPATENVMVGTNTPNSKSKLTVYAGANSTGAFALQVTTSITARDPQQYIVAYTTYGALSISTGSQPVLSSCGTGAAVRGGKYRFVITPGSAASGCTATFSTPFKNMPWCSASPQTESVVNSFAFTYDNTKLVITQTSYTSQTAVDCSAEGE